jgi:hypothetical protein
MFDFSSSDFVRVDLDDGMLEIMALFEAKDDETALLTI